MTDTIQNTIDGQQICTVLPPSGCCPPSICNLNLTAFVCSFLAYMPKGPLWDYWKRIKVEQLNSGVIDPYLETENPACLTLIDHAFYTAKKLFRILTGPLQTVIWESNPLTAFVTRQYWLDLFGWSDCFSGPSANVKLGFPTPYQAVCNALLPTGLCPPPTEYAQMSGNSAGIPNPIRDIEETVKKRCTAPLTLAVQYAILVAIKRWQLGVIKNQDGINFILEPLGAKITVTNTGVLPACQPVMEHDCNQMLGNAYCSPYRPAMVIDLFSTETTLPGGPGITESLSCSNIQQPLTKIPASYVFPGVIMPVTKDCPPGTIAGGGTIWPGLLAAECILVAILPFSLNYTINRIQET